LFFRSISRRRASQYCARLTGASRDGSYTGSLPSFAALAGMRVNLPYTVNLSEGAFPLLRTARLKVETMNHAMNPAGQHALVWGAI
jgi:hypothetical protein